MCLSTYSLCVLNSDTSCRYVSCDYMYLNPITYACHLAVDRKKSEVLYLYMTCICLLCDLAGSGWFISFFYAEDDLLCESSLPVTMYLPTVPCGIPSPPNHGCIVEFTYITTTDVVYRCDPGFGPPIEMTATCESGNWSPTPADLICTQTTTGIS